MMYLALQGLLLQPAGDAVLLLSAAVSCSVQRGRSLPGYGLCQLRILMTLTHTK